MGTAHLQTPSSRESPESDPPVENLKKSMFQNNSDNVFALIDLLRSLHCVIFIIKSLGNSMEQKKITIFSDFSQMRNSINQDRN